MSHINAGRMISCIFAAIRAAGEVHVQSAAVAPRFPIAGNTPIVTVVDDDPAVCGSLKFSLELEGFEVRAFGGAAELLSVRDFDACDCFVIDQRMPGMSGLELIAKLRDLKIRTPTILLISHPNPSVSARAAAAGVPIVEKPLLGNTLVDEVREACRQTRPFSGVAKPSGD